MQKTTWNENGQQLTHVTRRAIVIGASSGIGREVALLLAREGWKVGVAARREDRLLSLQQEVASEGKIVTARIDVTKEDAPEQLRHLINIIGGMDLFVYTSGVGHQNRTLTADVELATVETNALGFTRMIGEAYRYFAANPRCTSSSDHFWGHIVAVTSIAGTKGLGPAPAYSATKALQNNYLQALEQQAHQRKLRIRFTDIRPGFVDTDLLAGDFRYPMLLKTESVAADIVRSIHRCRHVRVIDWRYRLLTALWRRVPRWLWRYISL